VLKRLIRRLTVCKNKDCGRPGACAKCKKCWQCCQCK